MHVGHQAVEARHEVEARDVSRIECHQPQLEPGNARSGIRQRSIRSGDESVVAEADRQGRRCVR